MSQVYITCDLVYGVEQADWAFLLLIQPSYIAICSLPLAMHLLWHFLDVVGNAILVEVLVSLYHPSSGARSAQVALTLTQVPSLVGYSPGGLEPIIKLNMGDL